MLQGEGDLDRERRLRSLSVCVCVCVRAYTDRGARVTSSSSSVVGDNGWWWFVCVIEREREKDCVGWLGMVYEMMVERGR